MKTHTKSLRHATPRVIGAKTRENKMNIAQDAFCWDCFGKGKVKGKFCESCNGKGRKL